MGGSPIETFRSETTESWRRAFLALEYALVLEDVTKRFGDVVAVHDVSLRTPRGMIQGFLGPDGAGKTTMIRMIMSIIPADSGTIEVLGSRRPETVKDSVGYLPQERGLYGAMTARQLVAYFGKLKGMPARYARARAEDLLAEYGLADWRDTRCESIPKGGRRIVQILCAIVHGPELVILDEPFSGLDPVNEDVIRNIMLALKLRSRQRKAATISRWSTKGAKWWTGPLPR
jgi:ABC-2 type transport system ATP-binding protein